MSTQQNEQRLTALANSIRGGAAEFVGRLLAGDVAGARSLAEAVTEAEAEARVINESLYSKPIDELTEARRVLETRAATHAKFALNAFRNGKVAQAHELAGQSRWYSEQVAAMQGDMLGRAAG